MSFLIFVYAQSLGIKAFSGFGTAVNEFLKLRLPVRVVAAISEVMVPVPAYLPSTIASEPAKRLFSPVFTISETAL